MDTWCGELTHWKRPWCRERLKAGGEGDDRGWDDWMASQTWWRWVWARSRNWWWTVKPGLLQSMRSQRVGHDWATELNWIIRDVEHLYICLATVCMTSFEECLFRSSVRFWLCCFVSYWGTCALCICWKLVSYLSLYLQIFSSIMWFVFSLCLWFPLHCKIF